MQPKWTTVLSDSERAMSVWLVSRGPFECKGGMFARRAPGALLLDYVPPEEPPSTPLGNALRIR